MDPKIVTRAVLLEGLEALRRAGRRVVFTNGCFDILHAGHVRYLQAARACGDCLVVGLNSDRSVAAIKGPRRPIVTQEQRAAVLAAMACVDFVTLFDRPEPGDLIAAIRPEVLVKGADWEEIQIVGAAEVKAAGGEVVRIALEAGISTSAIIGRIVQRYC
ncbi:MAG: D-glycero-beta-D-manno-heptose 1-phosphate adenylyltransferase [Desulfobacteraceae bacterium]|nr:D-glycero-beta-D-manno-heptose 1-phosphate adenylyltransferase [Desulfobacteraceae bacterium]